MAPSGFGPYHGMSLEDAQTKCRGGIPTPWVMDDSCAWFGVISSTASAVGFAIERKKMLQVGSVHQEMFGGYFDGNGGVMARKKVSKSAQIIFNNKKGWWRRWKVVGGWRRWGAMTTDDRDGCDT